MLYDRSMTIQDRCGAAYHEAGHAVVATALNCSVRKIDIGKSDASGGVEIESNYQKMCFIARIAICHAGRLAEVLFNAPMHAGSAGGDLGEVASLLEGLDEDTDSKIQRAGKVLAEEFLATYKTSVERVAQHLIIHEKMDGTTFSQLFTGR